MICKLCLQDKPLLKKSHIAPNFLYKDLLDTNNSFVKAKLIEVTSKKVQTGLFEANILCDRCDNEILSKLEDYGYRVLYSGKIKGFSMRNEITPEGVEWTLCNGVDYKKFKLFLLSLIWRFSISSNEFYKFVDLGKDEEVVRKMIHEDDAGDILDYPCSLTSYRKHTDLPFQIISQPLSHIHEGCPCYGFIVNGFLYNFYHSKTTLVPDYVAEMVINKNNQLKVVLLSREPAIKIIRRYMGLIN